MTRPGVGTEVARVDDDDGVTVEKRLEFGVNPHRVQRASVVGQLGLLGGPPGRLDGPQSADPGLVVDGSFAREPRQRRGQVAVERGGHLTRMRALRRDAIGDDQPGLLAEDTAEPEPKIHRHADNQRNIGLLQRL